MDFGIQFGWSYPTADRNPCTTSSAELEHILVVCVAVYFQECKSIICCIQAWGKISRITSNIGHICPPIKILKVPTIYNVGLLVKKLNFPQIPTLNNNTNICIRECNFTIHF